MFASLLPKGAPFFELLIRQNDYLCKTASCLLKLLGDKDDAERMHREITLLEEEADAVFVSITRHLAQTFITPIDREDILQINKCQENAVDAVQDLATRFFILELPKARFSILKLGETLEAMTGLTASMLRGLAKKRDSHDTHKFRSLRNEGEMLLSVGLTELYDNPSPSTRDLLDIIKWNQAYDLMELAVNRVTALAEAIERAVLINA